MWIAQPPTQTYGHFQIDQLRSQKDEDLERYRKDIERRSRINSDHEYFDQSHKYNWHQPADIHNYFQNVLEINKYIFEYIQCRAENLTRTRVRLIECFSRNLFYAINLDTVHGYVNSLLFSLDSSALPCQGPAY